jgi:hypothetical protein
MCKKKVCLYIFQPLLAVVRRHGKQQEGSIYIFNWGSISHGVPQGSILGPLLFLIYIKDLPLVLNRISSPILFADDTSVIISNPDPLLFLNCVNEVLNKLKLWFNTNLLFLNFSKTDFIKFNTKNAHDHDIKILYDNTETPTSSCIKFLGVNIANTLSWKNHIDSLIPKYSLHVMQSEP